MPLFAGLNQLAAEAGPRRKAVDDATATGVADTGNQALKHRIAGLAWICAPGPKPSERPPHAKATTN
jgi:hypothetical protein